VKTRPYRDRRYGLAGDEPAKHVDEPDAYQPASRNASRRVEADDNAVVQAPRVMENSAGGRVALWLLRARRY